MPVKEAALQYDADLEDDEDEGALFVTHPSLTSYTPIDNRLIYRSDISCEARLMYIILMSFAVRGEGSPGLTALGKLGRCGQAVVTRLLDELIESGVLARERLSPEEVSYRFLRLRGVEGDQ